MTYDEVVSQVESAALHVIRVEEITDSHADLEFAGELTDFLKAAKALRAEVAFVSVMTLSESTFSPYVPGRSNEYIDYDNEPAEIEFDLCKLLPELGKYKKMVGIPGHYALLVPYRDKGLKFSIIEDWWINFVECFSEARLLADQRYRNLADERLAEEQAERNKILEKLRKLVSDKNFGNLPTQIAMREYALEKIPELSEIDESELKHEIQSLKARILARS
ncbi:hypothetical protein EOE67_13990 [Rheinheimera riviphila]|uniref:Uncharacterized protein n=1 Tax=Rheinheimera riviphila TaxID=1834037 RepID=A0A437QLT1_9GAMM|nr:hypothetical protein [Rheinheimera riviphila]RVU35478.1 hypothetical protein EOE67_13990 [Rheinheimera riviphila]